MEGPQHLLTGPEQEQQGVGEGFLGMEEFSFGEPVNGSYHGTEKLGDTIEAREKSIEDPLPQERQSSDTAAERRESIDTTYSQIKFPDGDQPDDTAPSRKERGHPRSERRESTDITHSEINSIDGGQPRKKRGRPRKSQVPEVVAVASSTPAKAFTPLPPLPDLPPGTVRTSSRPQRPPPVIYEPEELKPRANSKAIPAPAPVQRPPTTRRVIFTPYEDLQREEDERDRAAGTSRVYLYLSDIAKPPSADKPIKRRPKQSTIAVFKSNKLRDPQWLEKNKGSWVPAYSAIRAAIDIAAEDRAKAEKRDAGFEEVDGEPVKKRRKYMRKDKKAEKPTAASEPANTEKQMHATLLEDSRHPPAIPPVAVTEQQVLATPVPEPSKQPLPVAPPAAITAEKGPITHASGSGLVEQPPATTKPAAASNSATLSHSHPSLHLPQVFTNAFSPYNATPKYRSPYQVPATPSTSAYRSPYASGSRSTSTTNPVTPISLQNSIQKPSCTPTPSDRPPERLTPVAKPIQNIDTTATYKSPYQVPATPIVSYQSPYGSGAAPTGTASTTSPASSALPVSSAPPAIPAPPSSANPIQRPSYTPTPAEPTSKLAVVAHSLQNSSATSPYKSPYQALATPTTSYKSPYASGGASMTTIAPISSPNSIQRPPLGTPRPAHSESQRPASASTPPQIPTPGPTTAPIETPTNVARLQHHQYRQFGSGTNSSSTLKVPAQSPVATELARDQNSQYAQCGFAPRPSFAPTISPQSSISTEAAKQQNYEYAQFGNSSSPPTTVSTQHPAVPNVAWPRPATPKGQCFDVAHEQASWSQMPQTPWATQPTVSQKRSLSDFSDALIIPVPKRMRSSLEISRPPRARTSTTKTPRKNPKSSVPASQPDTSSTHRPSMPGFLKELPTPRRSTEDEERLEDAELTVAESIEIGDAAAKMSSVFNGRVGNLILSKDKFTLTFIGVTQKPPEVPHLILPVADIIANPFPSNPGSKRMELIIKVKEENGSRVTYKFRVKSTDQSSEILNGMRYEIVQGMVIVDLQKRRRMIEENPEFKPGDKPFKCDTCDGSWLNREGIKYHKEKSHTYCNPSWIQQTWQQFPTFLPDSETGAWNQLIRPEYLHKRPYTKKQKVLDLELPLETQQKPAAFVTEVWQQPPAFLPNPETGAWNQAPAPPVHVPLKRTAGKKRKHAVDAIPELEVEQEIVEQRESSVEDDEEAFLEWLDDQEGSRKRQRRESTGSESADVYMPEADAEEDIPFEEELSDSDFPYGERLPPKNMKKRGPWQIEHSQNMKDRWALAKALGKTSLAGLPKPNSSLTRVRSKWVNPKVKNPMTEEEKAGKRARAVLRQQMWTQPIAFLPNPETGAWDQPPTTRPPKRPYIYQRRYRLPAPVTFMQAANGTWSFRPFGHGAPPIFARPGRRADGNPHLPNYLARVEAGYRPVRMPKRGMLGPAVPSMQLLRKLGRRDASTGSAESLELQNMLQPEALPGLPGPHSSSIAGTKKRAYRKRRQDSVVDEDEDYNGKILQTRRRTYNRGQSSAADSILDGDVMESAFEDPPRRSMRSLKANARVSYDPLVPTQCPVPNKLDPQVGRQINPGLDSLPQSFGLRVYRSHDDQFSEPKATANFPGSEWPSITLQDGSFASEGWWPDDKWFLDNGLPANLSLTDGLAKKASCSSQDVHKDPDLRSIGFVSQVEQIAEWEQVIGDYMLGCENQALDHRWINHTTKSWKGLREPEPTQLQWLDGNAFTVESIPYSELASIGEDVTLVEQADVRVDGRINNRGPRRLKGAVAPTNVTKHKRRPLTALPVDFEGIMDSPEEAATSLGAELAPGNGNRLRRQRFDRQDGAMSLDMEARLIIAVVVTRTLTGGLDQQVDWVLIHRMFPDFSMNYLSKTFTDITKRKRTMIDKLGEEFRDPFLKAYEAGELGYLNYDKLLDYDWPKLVDWVMKNVSVSVDMESETLPGTRDELEEEFDVEIVDEGKNWRDLYYGLNAPVYRRMENVAAYPYTTPLKQQPKFNEEEEVDDLMLAKSWARAIALTPEDVWDLQVAGQKLLVLGQDLVQEAVDSLLASRVLVHKSKQRRAMPGRSYETSVQFADALRKHISDTQFIEAANFKAYLDAQFADPDGEARQNGIKFNTLADEGTVMCVTNLQAQGRINLVPVNVPNNRFGLTDGGYETRKLDKRKFHFDILIFPSPTYLPNQQIPELHSLSKMTPPGSGSRGELPVWCDIEERVMSGLWRKVVVAILGVVSLRAGIDTEALKRELAPAMEEWELRIFMWWAVEVGALVDVSVDLDIGHGEEFIEGWSAGEWWWLVAGMVCLG